MKDQTRSQLIRLGELYLTEVAGPAIKSLSYAFLYLLRRHTKETEPCQSSTISVRSVDISGKPSSS